MLLLLGIVFRGVAQLVERVVWDHEVARSIRVTPTRIVKFEISYMAGFILFYFAFTTILQQFKHIFYEN